MCDRSPTATTSGSATLLGALSIESRWLRFFSAGVDLDRMARWAASRGSGRGYGVVATVGTPERIVGHAAYVETAPGKAEIAFEVSDDRHGLGIGTVLLAHLAGVAPSHGIERFVATVHPSNHRMAQVLRDSGFPVEVTVGPRRAGVRAARARWTPTRSPPSTIATESPRSRPCVTSCARGASR